MPAHLFVDAPNKMVFSKVTGVFSRADAFGHMARLLRHPDFRPNFNQLFDSRHATDISLSADDIRELAAKTVFSRGSKRAFVASSPVQFGLSRMFGLYREGLGEIGVQSFNGMPEALAWLNLSAEPDPKLFEIVAVAGDVEKNT